jgi:hypothetical protein
LPQKVSYLPESIDATSVDPTVVCGFRTLFTSFHHFEPDMATELLSDAVRSGEGIAVFEFTRRHPVALLSFFLAPWLIPFSLPFHGRRGWRDWLWTFPIPILPLVVLFDGLVSCLRTYSPEQCLELASVADPDGRFDWEAGVKFSLPAGMTYLVGTPRRTEAEHAVTS